MVGDPPGQQPSESQLRSVAVLLVDDDEQWARVTARLLESAEPAFEVTLAHSLAEGDRQFRATDPDCVICDYQLGDGTGLCLLETVRERDPDRPFVLVTGRGDETVASEAIGRGVTDYILKQQDDTDGSLLANRVRNAVQSARAQRQLDRERRGKSATLDILRSTTNVGDLSAQFCRLLVEDHGYAGAWIGGFEDGPESGIIPRAVEGCEAYLDAVADDGVVSTDSADPAVTAARTDEPIVVSYTDRPDSSIPEQYSDATETWQRLARDHGFVTAVGIPIRHDGVREGVLGVYCSPEEQPLDDHRWELLEEYARIVGYAHQTAGLKQSLLSEQSVRVDIEIGDTAAPLAELTAQLGEGVSVEVLSTIGQADNTTLYLTEISGTGAESVRTAADSCEALELDSVSPTADGVRCDIRSTVRTPEEMLASQGAQIERTVSTAGSVTVSVSVGDHSAISSLTDTLRTEYDDVTVTTLWNHRDEQASSGADDPLASLTEKQRNVLSHAYFDGYFEQPRGVSATELSEKFDISRVTMTQHLRTAQRKVFRQLFDESDEHRS